MTKPIEADCHPEVLVTFARPEESAPFRKKLQSPSARRIGGHKVWRGSLHGCRIAVVHTGVGPASAEAVLRDVLREIKPARVLCTGFGGALDPSLRVGDTLTADLPSPVIISRADPIEHPQEKIAAFRATGARVVDMEAEAVARICAESQIPVTAVRAISDAADQSLPIPFGAWFDMSRQRARPLALVLHLLCHPSHIAPFARFVSRLPAVSRALAQAVDEALEKIA